MAPEKTFDEYQREKRDREWTQKVASQKADMSNQQRVDRAADWKKRGNDKFKAGNLPEARDYYKEAIVYVEDLVDARRAERVALLMPLYTNLAQVHLKMDSPKDADEVAGKAVDIAVVDRNQVPAATLAKALFRRGASRLALCQHEMARDDFVRATKLLPGSEEINQKLAEVREFLAEQKRQSKAAMGGFFQREELKRNAKHEMESRKHAAEEQRAKRRALAEERQMMQTAFGKLAQQKEMLYDEREKAMEPVRQAEARKRETLELEQNLTNVLDESKGLEKTENFDAFMDKKMERCKKQHGELDRKKDILDKQTREKQWDKDDVWREQRLEHRRQLEERRQEDRPGAVDEPKAAWEATEVSRWCDQRLRKALLEACIDGKALEDGSIDAAANLRLLPAGWNRNGGRPLVLKAVVTDIVELTGDACVMRLNPRKPPLHYYDYSVKLKWEVAVAEKGAGVYRTAEELITVAAEDGEQKAPASDVKDRLASGCFEVLEFSSEEAAWDVACAEDIGEGGERSAVVKLPEVLAAAVDEARGGLRSLVASRMEAWAEEYREYWP